MFSAPVVPKDSPLWDERVSADAGNTVGLNVKDNHLRREKEKGGGEFSSAHMPRKVT